MLTDFITLIERYDPGYTYKIKGAAAGKISHLEELISQPLPAYYREFLTVMGDDTGGLDLEDVNLHIDSIISFYERGEWIPPEGYILFGIEEGVTSIDYYLESTEITDDAVVRFPSEGVFSKDEYFSHLDPSLKDFLVSWGFSEKRMEHFKQEKYLFPSSRKKGAFDIINIPAEILNLIYERAVQQLGFEYITQSTATYRFFDRKDAAIYIRFDEGDNNLGITVAAQKQKELQHIITVLSNQTSLVTS
jgi:hypothetical protein